MSLNVKSPRSNIRPAIEGLALPLEVEAYVVRAIYDRLAGQDLRDGEFKTVGCEVSAADPETSNVHALYASARVERNGSDIVVWAFNIDGTIFPLEK